MHFINERTFMSSSLLIRNVRPMDASPAVDVLVQDGRIAAIGAGLSPPPGTGIEEGGGALLLPGLVEGHTHLDKTMWGMDWYRNEVGVNLTDKIENERAFRHDSGHDAAAQSLVLAKAFLALGTTRLRTHVDVDTQAGLRHLEGTMQTRQTLRNVQQIQIVAFPQSGLLGRPGTAELLDQSLAMGADVLGGLDPCAIDGDPVKSLDVLFGIGGTPEGVIAAAGIKCLGGSIQGRLWPRNDDERRAALDMGYDLDHVLTTDDLVAGDDVFFAATGVTDGDLLRGVRYWGDGASTQSLVMRSKSGTIRIIDATHKWTKLMSYSAVRWGS